MEYYSHTLANGLRIVHKPTDGQVSYCGFLVNVGTRDEQLHEYGMAHFVEHMIFKGTEKRRSHHIIQRMERVGGDLNAYTNKEETVIYSTFLEPHFPRAVELLSDLIFHSTFPQNEIDKEIDVVIDEIQSYEDSPSELIYDDFENLIFEGSEIGHNILGEVKTLETFDTKMISSFYKKHYVPSNMVFFSMGKTNFNKIVRLAEMYMADIPLINYKSIRHKPDLLAVQRKQIIKETSQSHVMIGCQAYPIGHEKRHILNLVNNILGGPGMNSRLNISLREKKGYVYNIDSSITAYSDSGLFSIYFGCDKKNTQKCISLVEKELKKIKETALSETQLAMVKKQLIGQIGVSSDNRENVALGVGKAYMYYGEIKTLERIFQSINKISSKEILAVVNELFDEKQMFHLIYD